MKTGLSASCLRFGLVFYIVLSSWFFFPRPGITLLTALLAPTLPHAALAGAALVSGVWLVFAALTPLGSASFAGLLGTGHSLVQLSAILAGIACHSWHSTEKSPATQTVPRRFLLPLNYVLLVFSILLMFSSLFRSSPLLHLPWGLASSLYVVHQICRKRLPLPSYFFRYGVTILLILSGTLFLVETGSRLLLTRFPIPVDFFIPCDYDPELVFRPRPGARGVFLLKDNFGQVIHVEGRVSNQGIRDREFGPKAANEFRIVLLGDSYAMGHGLEPEETFARNLENLLNDASLPCRVTVVNCGVGGYAPWQERLFLQKYGFAFEPDLVLLQLFPPNDIAGSYNRNSRWLPVIHERWERRVYDFGRQHEFPFRAERWLKIHMISYRLGMYASGLEPPPVRSILANCRLFTPIAYPQFRSAFPRDPLREACLRDWYPELQEAWGLFEDAIRGIQSDCKSRTIQLAAFVHGELISLKPEPWIKLNSSCPGICYDKDKDIRLACDLLDRLDIPQADLLSGFRSYGNPDELYFVNDGHFSPVGAQVVAVCLRDFLLEKNLLPSQ